MFRGLCVSVCLTVTTKNCAKTVEPIEMPVGVWTRVGSRNLVLEGEGRGRHHREKGIFFWGGAFPGPLKSIG